MKIGKATSLALGILLFVGLAVPLFLVWSARASLDDTRAHSRATEGLPLFSAQTRDGLVRIPVGSFEFRARVAGFDGDGPGLILLHGFPESSIMWEPLVARAAAEGFRVVAFDQRGYSPGARPAGVDAYRVPHLVEDVLGVASAVGFERFHLVGHDWGSIVGWAAASFAPSQVLSWAALSIPHPGALSDPDLPAKRPAYFSVFRAKGVAEVLLGFGGLWPMRSLFYSRTSPAHRAEYEALFSEPGALTATLNWYRGLSEDGGAEDADPVVHQPVLYIYGRDDLQAFVSPAIQSRLAAFVDGPFETIALDAGHFIIQEEEGAVIDALMRHFDSVRF